METTTLSALSAIFGSSTIKDLFLTVENPVMVSKGQSVTPSVVEINDFM